ncbi:hypothetical protein H8M03_01680 [Sphingomonas sabuli]|uniref:Uncharacterized protein n=1 Tax=Sphingomonas sabuli TaxID=2764186 RepID=A0A7G9L399_9SPHN|nr:hypothetical protein [Sphingomonas sabuli]QNM83098.1 hypothetical protein H8M03_01680 [Sphingomonas sabuli]
MTKIEIFMMMYSLLIGLAMAGLMSGIGELLRGREKPQWGVLVPLASAVLFTTLLGAFAEAYSYRNIGMSFSSMGLPAIAGVLYYLAAILTVPREQDGWNDLDAYFLARKHLIFGSQLAALTVLVFGVEVPRAVSLGRPIFSNGAYWFGNLAMIALLAVPIVTSRRAAIIAAMIGTLVMLCIIYVLDQPMADTFRALLAFFSGG